MVGIKNLAQPLLCYDVMFKAIFTGEENLLAKMIADITGIDYELLKDNIILETNELPISTKNEKAKRCDFVLRVLDNKIINLELNAYRYQGLMIKNLSYLFELFSSTSKKGNKYNEDLLVMQINLNGYKEEVFKPLAKYYLQEENIHKFYVKNLVIYDLNVVKRHELYYNQSNKDDIPNYVRWGALIYCDNFEEIPDIVRGIMTDKERDRIMSKLNKLTREDLFYTEEEALEWAEWERRSIEAEARQDGIKEIIKKMVEKGMSLEDISDITGKTIEEVKQIVETEE